MLGPSRRIFWYWLLLLLPTLAVGAGAILLLKREQSRLASRTASAEQARRAALEARTQLVAENVELLIGDIEDGLLDAMVQLPNDTLPESVERWQKSQPLARVAFLAKPNGELIKPSADAVGDDARGFVRRFGPLLSQAPPWRGSEVQALRVPDAQLFGARDSAETLAPVSQQANIARVQTARREAKTLAKNSAPALSSMRSRNDPTNTGAAPEKDQWTGSAEQTRQAAPMEEARRGWTGQVAGGHLHVLGWVQTSSSAIVRGLELEMAALTSRLGGALPSDVELGEGFALRDEKGRVLHQAGTVPAPSIEPTIRLPLGDAAFPGWEVVAYLPMAYGSFDVGNGFFLIGALLTGILVVAILSGGSLLLWQARRSEAEAEQKTSFVANVSHEFKTPLTSIRLYSELLEQGRVQNEAKRIEYLRTIGRETQRLARLVNNALDFSRLEQGQKKYRLEPTDLRAEMIRILDTQRPRLDELKLQVELLCPTTAVNVVTDRDAYEQIVLNLIDNACKYAAAGGELHVELVAHKPTGIEMRVADRGPGVPAEHRQRIFEKFHRVDQTLTAEKSGAGLGLSIARQLARGIGGDLSYEPREGGGSVFVLSLPQAID